MPAPLTPLTVRRYRLADRAVCLALFEGNIPGSFLREEVTLFTAFLDQLAAPYYLALDAASAPVACGGLGIRDDAAVLCWGMVDARRHREGIGRVLLRLRLAAAARKAGVARVTMNTSNETAPFFLREGFTTVEVLPNYFRQGLHRHDLALALTEEARRGIEARLAATLAEGHQVEEGWSTW